VERVDRAQVGVFYAPEPFTAGAITTLGEDAAHHMRVRRTEVGERVRLVDGEGHVGDGRLVRLAKGSATIDVERVERRAPAPAVHLLVPVGDRDRMLWLAEKCAELALTSWRPVLWRRSRSVTPRGEGAGFQARARSRMAAALTQSEGGWLPVIYPDATVERAIAATPPGTRLLLDPDGAPITGLALEAPVTIALGPEGGLERDERERMVDAGFAPVALAGNILRFETAGVVALGIVRAHLAGLPITPEPDADG
jgi:16S rRNA (uracil1498-N3)-methyltransferase